MLDTAHPAHRQGSLCGNDDCPCAQLGTPCQEWEGGTDFTWCPRCGWNQAAHVFAVRWTSNCSHDVTDWAICSGCRPGPAAVPAPRDELADLRARHTTVLAYLDQRAGTPGAGPTVPADLIRAMLTEETPDA